MKLESYWTASAPAFVPRAADLPSQCDVAIVGGGFTGLSAALALARGDEDFRLLVDRSLSQLYGSDEFAKLAKQWFGGIDDKARAFFLWSTPGP
jgi:flavin-dependent dehydrogenase